MADIVETLRHLADAVEAQQAPHNYVLHLRAGADEIARLRAGGCARDQGTTQYCGEAAKKDAEIASLLNTLADARSESMRLRAALREIIADSFSVYAIQVARAALEEGRSCTCHPSEAPTPCQRKYALGDCIKAALEGK